MRGSSAEKASNRRARLMLLTPLQQDELFHVIGEAAVDLWLHDEAWPDIVERCLEAIEDTAAADDALVYRLPVA